MLNKRGCQNKQEIHKFLLNYRATPHVSTGVSPAELMFQGRQFRMKLPEISRKYDEDIRKKDEEAKRKMKQVADRKSYVKFSHLKVGDMVLVKTKRTRKLDTPYNPTPYKIIMKKGSMVTAEAGNGHRITRNVSFFKHLMRDNLGDTFTLTPEDGENIPVTVTEDEIIPVEEEEPVLPEEPEEDEEEEDPVMPEEDAEPEVVEVPRYPQRDRHAPSYLADYET